MKLELAEFVRIYALRAKKISWLFGAGSSVSAGLPSAFDLIWDFKRRIYCSEQGYQLGQFMNLSDNGTRMQIQNYFDSFENSPKFNSPEEYSYYFEKAFSSPMDRKNYLDSLLSGMNLSYGHRVIGVLMKNQMLNLIFTTNFDHAFDNTAVQSFGNTENWYKTDLDNAQTGLQFFQDAKFPLIVKLHGDYHSNKLKNTTDELQKQDEKLRHILTISSYVNGLAVMGYSGRDASVMAALNEAIEQNNSFPNGIFWFIRPNSEPLCSVTDFISKARSKDIDANFIEIDTFDTAWASIIKGFDNIPSDDIETLNQNYFRKENKPVPQKGTRPPMIRLNAIKISQLPNMARLFKCDAGNTKELKELIDSKKGEIIAIRKRGGIVGFGSDKEFQRVFQGYGEYEMDLFNIAAHLLNYDDSSIKGLITECLCKAIANNDLLAYTKRGKTNFIIPNHNNLDNPIFGVLKNEFNGKIIGKIPSTEITWILGVEIFMQRKLDQTYLVLNPTVVATKSEIESEKRKVGPFIKEFMARWYNDKYDRLLTYWIDMILSNNQELEIYAFENIGSHGVNALFKLHRRSAHTKSI